MRHDPPSPHDLRLLWAGLATMVATRLALVLLLAVQPTSDMGWYYQRAIGILDTGRYAEGALATAFWPVGYPAFLAAVMSLAGTSVLAGQLANLLLSVVCALLLYRLCLRHGAGPRAAALAVCLLAVYPNHMGYSLGLYSEPLYTALLLAMCWLVRPGSGAAGLAFAGVVAGLATLVKAQMLLLVAPLAFLLSLAAWSRPALVVALRQAVLVSALAALTLAPWVWRNHVVMGAFIPVSTNGGLSLLSGNNPSMSFDLRSDFNDTDPLFQRVNFSVADQVAADGRARAAAWAWIRDNPLTFVALMPKKFVRLWLPDGETEWILQRGYAGYERWQTAFRAVRVANQLYYFALLAGFAWALYRCVRMRDPATLVVPLLLLFFSALSLVFSGQSRYHAPLMPFVIGYAAWASVRWWQRPQ